MTNNRRTFLAQLAILGNSMVISNPLLANVDRQAIKKIGIIGLVTSHSEMFAKDINTGELNNHGYR